MEDPGGKQSEVSKNQVDTLECMHTSLTLTFPTATFFGNFKNTKASQNSWYHPTLSLGD